MTARITTHATSCGREMGMAIECPWYAIGGTRARGDRSMAVGTNIRYWRERRSYDQAELARLTGFGVNTLNRIERGLNQPRRATVRKLAEFLKVDPAVLWDMADIHGDAITPAGGHDGQ